MHIKLLTFRPAVMVWMLLLALSLSAQTDQYELEIGDRLYAHEMARVSQDFDAMLSYTYPALFSLIPRENLREQLALMATEAAATPSRLPDFQVRVLGAPVETNGLVFVRVSLSYGDWRPLVNDKGDSTSPTFLRAAIRGDESRNTQRKLLAVRMDADLNWYFLEVGNGQEALLSSIIPASLLRDF